MSNAPTSPHVNINNVPVAFCMARKPGKIVDKMLATDIDEYALVFSVKTIAASRIFEIRNTF